MRKSINYIEGDLFASIDPLIKDAAGPRILIPHVCNNVGAWGAGFVVPLGRQYPLAKSEYLRWHHSGCTIQGAPFMLGNTQIVDVSGGTGKPMIANMIAQDGLGGEGARPRMLRYDALAACMLYIGIGFNPDNLKIFCPMFGSGIAGGDWSFVSELITDTWVRRGFDVTVCYLPGQVPNFTAVLGESGASSPAEKSTVEVGAGDCL